MHRFVTAGGPACALWQGCRVVVTSNENLTALDLLEMAFHAQVRVPRGEHFRVHRTMRRVANRAAFAQRFVFENLRPAL